MGTLNQFRWEKECGVNSYNFWGEIFKTLPSPNGISQPSKILTFCIFYISVFVNTTAMVVNSCAILYMCMEVIICQSDRSPQRVMLSQTPGIGELQISSGGRRNVEKTLPTFGSEFCKTFLSQNRTFLTFQKCGIFELPHFCICQYYSYGSELLY